jgi:hypothetical protein
MDNIHLLDVADISMGLVPEYLAKKEEMGRKLKSIKEGNGSQNVQTEKGCERKRWMLWSSMTFRRFPPSPAHVYFTKRKKPYGLSHDEIRQPFQRRKV